MVTMGLNYEVIEGRQTDFERVFQKMLQVMEVMAGHEHTELYRNVTRPRSYMIVSYWSSQAAFEAFTHSDQFRDVADWGREKILADLPRHEFFGEPQVMNTAATNGNGGNRRPVGSS